MSSESLLVFAGAISGFAEAIVVQPFDMMKTRHQLNSSANEGILKTMSTIYKEGGFFRFYRGMTAELVGIVPKSSGMYASYEIARRELSKNLGDTSLTASLAGTFSGIPEACIVQPTQVIKVRLQAKEHLGKYSGSFDCLTKIVRNEGFMALTIGLTPTLYRNCVWNTVYFGTMHWLKSQVPEPSSSLMSHLHTLGTGFFGAVFATCFNAPFDVVKSRFQSQIPLEVQMAAAAASGQAAPTQLKYRNTFQTLFLIYREEGFFACYKGFKPKAIRMGLGGGVAMMTFELIQKIAGKETNTL